MHDAAAMRDGFWDFATVMDFLPAGLVNVIANGLQINTPEGVIQSFV